ncbi:leucine-rich repeat-containing protein 72 isoform X3 [Archocentrus centrarchus]|uniref:leucine-rich repeat-containing protein 72 isoform X3 n=1 Tax=Archocentrus centrarchus TaxID=63155 RepID=UPI0011E9DDDB|nr:leucine-rich repeat-containing protein 72 isoform X3 [Archocentrus centrarchus]
MEATKVIEDSVQKRGIRRDCDVCELRLATKFRLLRKLRLNNNKIRELSCHSLNCCLTELYLHNNNIKSVSGALSHLTCLQILFLHNNCIRGLEDTMYELRRMQQLQNANLRQKRSEASREEEDLPDLQTGSSSRPPVCGFRKTPVIPTMMVSQESALNTCSYTIQRFSHSLSISLVS